MIELETLQTIHAERMILEHTFALAAKGKKLLSILEAGCGRQWPINMEGIRHEITGVDCDEHALTHRQKEIGDLQHVVLGDLTTVSFKANSFDVVYSSYVLEHISGAERVLESFATWLKPGGLMIIKIPARDSVVGWFTRILPFWLHVAFYRYIAEKKDAGKPGHAPYPTFHDPVISLQGIRDFCRKNNLRLRNEFCMDFGYHYRHLPLSLVQRLKLHTVNFVIRLFGIASLGSLASRYNSLLFIIDKPD